MSHSDRLASLAARLDRVAFSIKMASPDFGEIMDVLESLQELDANLDAVEQSFAKRYSSLVTAAPVVPRTLGPIDPEIQTQQEVLSKANEGLKKAKEAKAALEALLQIHAGEKAAERAIQEADRLVSKYERHAEAARKIIITTAKKQVPPYLKKATDALVKLVKARLANPDALEVIPWVYNGTVHSRRGDIKTVLYSYTLILRNVTKSEYGQTKTEDKRYVVQESPFGYSGSGDLAVSFMYGAFMSRLGDTPQEAANAIFEDLRGWTGLAGEGEAMKKRQQNAKLIEYALGTIARKWGRDGYETYPSRGDDVQVAFQRWPKESEDQYPIRDRIDSELKAVRQDMEKALAPYKDSIKQFGVGLGDKGWGEMYVRLK